MIEHHIPDGLMHEAYQLFQGGHTTDEVKGRFLARDLDPALVDEVVATVKAMRLKKRRANGLICCGVGAVLLVMAFVITYALHQFNIETDFALYGLTTLGVAFLFLGMVFFMG